MPGSALLATPRNRATNANRSIALLTGLIEINAIASTAPTVIKITNLLIVASYPPSLLRRPPLFRIIPLHLVLVQETVHERLHYRTGKGFNLVLRYHRTVNGQLTALEADQHACFTVRQQTDTASGDSAADNKPLNANPNPNAPNHPFISFLISDSRSSTPPPNSFICRNSNVPLCETP